MSYQKIIIVGNLTRDPELRYTPQSKAVATLGVAVNSSYGGKDEVLFIDCIVWEKQAESCAQYLSKGRQVLVEGRLQERKWETDGQKHSKMEIVSQSVKFLGGKQEQEQKQGHEAAPEEVSDVQPF